MSLVLAVIPILIVLIGIIFLKKPAWIVALIGAGITFILAVTAFSGEIPAMAATAKSGVISALQVAFLVWGAFALLELMQVSTGMNRIKTTVSSLTKDRREQIVLIAFCLGVFIEGATGNGAPAAILAPFLLGLGFEPLVAAAACLISNGVPPCFGGAGVPTIAGMSAITDQISLASIVAMTGRFLAIGCLLVPVVLLVVLYGRKSLKGMWGYLASVSICMGASMLLVTNFIGAELADLITGVVGVAASVAYLKLVGVKENEAYVNESDATFETSLTNFKAFLPYILLLILLPAVRFSFPLSALTKYGYATWIGAVIHLVVLISSCAMGCGSKFILCEKNAILKLIKPIITLCALYALANLMNSSGMISRIARFLADVAGGFYPAVSVIIGAIGAFITGSCLGSNKLFCMLHLEAASTLGINQFVAVTASSAGGSLGNMICPNNIIAVNATLELKNAEGAVFKRTIKAFLIMTAVYCVLAMVYAYILFPEFGL